MWYEYSDSEDEEQEIVDVVEIDPKYRCASEEELRNFFSKHAFIGEVSHTYFDWQDHSLITGQDNVIYEELDISH